MVLIFTILFLVGVTPTKTDHEKRRIKVIHVYIISKSYSALPLKKKELFSYASTACLADHATVCLADHTTVCLADHPTVCLADHTTVCLADHNTVFGRPHYSVFGRPHYSVFDSPQYSVWQTTLVCV